MKSDEIKSTLKDPCLLNLACGLGTLTLVYQLLLKGHQAWGHYISVLVYGFGFILGLWSWWLIEQQDNKEKSKDPETDKTMVPDKLATWLIKYSSERLRYFSYVSSGVATLLLIIFVGIDVVCLQKENLCDCFFGHLFICLTRQINTDVSITPRHFHPHNLVSKC